jgi:ParB family chromosome partitioning protein
LCALGHLWLGRSVPIFRRTVRSPGQAGYGIKKAKDNDSLGKLFTAYLCRAEESVLGSVLVETTILYMSTRHNPAQVLNEAATVYKVDTDAIALKVKQEFAAKERSKKTPKTVSKVKKAA